MLLVKFIFSLNLINFLQVLYSLYVDTQVVEREDNLSLENKILVVKQAWTKFYRSTLIENYYISRAFMATTTPVLKRHNYKAALSKEALWCLPGTFEEFEALINFEAL